MSTDDGLILIYTALAKPSYRRGIFSALSYPQGHVVRYSYRRSHFHSDLVRDLDQLWGKRGLIIYVDVDERKAVTYFPVRFACIHQLPTPAAQTFDRERIYLPLRLGDFVEYQADGDRRQWHDTVSQFDYLREITGREPGKPKYFVVDGKDVFAQPTCSEKMAWENVVVKLAESCGLSDGVFLKLDHLKDYSSRSEVDRRLVAEQLIYDLNPGGMYRLDFSVYEKPERVETKIVVKTSSTELLTVDQPFQSVVSGLVEESTLIACRRTTETALATVSLSVEGGSIVPQKVSSPAPVLFVRVSYPRWVIVAFVLAISLGTLLVFTDSGTVKEVLPAGGKHLAWTLGLKCLGTVFLAGGAWLAFRRLPSARS